MNFHNFVCQHFLLLPFYMFDYKIKWPTIAESQFYIYPFYRIIIENYSSDIAAHVQKVKI